MNIALFLDVDKTLTRDWIQREYARALKCEGQYLKIEQELQLGDIDEAEFGDKLIDLFAGKNFTEETARWYSKDVDLQPWTEQLLNLPNVDKYLVSSGPSYYIDALAEKYRIPKENVCRSIYRFNGPNGVVDACDPVNPAQKAQFTHENAKKYLLTIGVGDNPEKDAFISHCTIPLLTSKKAGYIYIPDLTSVVLLAGKLSAMTLPAAAQTSGAVTLNASGGGAVEDRKGLKFWQQVVLAVIAIIGPIVTGVLSHERGLQQGRKSAENLPHIIVRVYDSVTNQGLPQARLNLVMPNGDNQSDVTGGDGQHTFLVQDEKLVGNVAKLQIAKNGYTRDTFEVLVTHDNQAKSYYLTPASAKSVAVSSPADPPRHYSVNLQEVLPKTVEQVETSSNTIEMVNDSGSRLSGEGTNFSDWYTLCSNPPPAGYKIVSVDFKLSGDRSCGAWAECRQTVLTGQTACYQFRMQGHDERNLIAQVSGGKVSNRGTSTGILRVTLQKQ